MRDIIRKLLRVSIYIMLFAVIGSYAYDRTKNALFGPRIVITTPTNGTLIYDDLITISGQVSNASRLYLNGRKIYTDEKSQFNEELLLHYGYNIIEVRAEDRFGQEKKEILQLVFQ